MKLLLLSNSRTEGMRYLEHAAAWLREFLPRSVDEVLFVPYAAVTKSHYDYVEEVSPVFAALGARVSGIHRAHDPNCARIVWCCRRCASACWRAFRTSAGVPGRTSRHQRS